jgi:hypothetical protein
MKGNSKTRAAATILSDALMLVIFVCVPSAHGASCLLFGANVPEHHVFTAERRIHLRGGRHTGSE